jgi:cytoskeleton protein RodZ
LHDERQITSWILAAIVLVLVIAGLAVWWWNGGTFAALPSPRETPAPATTPVPEAVEAPATTTAPQPLEQLAVPAVAPAASAAEAGVPPATDAPASRDPDPVAFTAPVEQADGGDAEQPTPVVAISLEFSFAEESWAEVTDGRGERLLYGLNAAGRRVTVRGEPPFAVVLGNSAGVRITLDGVSFPVPTSGQPGASARFSVDVGEE